VPVIFEANLIKFIVSRAILSGWLSKLTIILEQYDLVYVLQKAIKGQVVPNFLVNNPVLDDWELNDD